jgi:lipopolysaccharide export system protein LptC
VSDQQPDHEKLSQWYSQERERTTKSAKWHTSIISTIKLLSILIAFLLLASLLIWPLVFTPEETFNLKFAPMETDESETPVMINPKFHGVDEKQQPYNVIAMEAVQEGDNVIYIKGVSGDITIDGGQWLNISSDEGRINTKDKKAKLFGNVNIISDDGFEFITDVAYIDFNKNSANGDKPVVGQGPMGTLHATGFTIMEGADTILFSGPIKMIIYPGTGL